jgi:hypothetical protein
LTAYYNENDEGAAARDWRSDRSQKSSEEMYGSKGRPLPRQAIEAKPATWCSPTAVEGRRENMPPRPHDTGVPLAQQVAALAMWPTAQSTDSTSNKESPESKAARGSGGINLSTAAHLNGSSESTEKRAALAPIFVAWLMHYPPSWVECGVKAFMQLKKR